MQDFRRHSGSWLESLAGIVREAGKIVLDVYTTDFEVRGKGDDSPVTVADERAEKQIVAALKLLAPEIPVVAEEAVASGRVPAVDSHFWLVDPLDGTKEFISRNGEFTVNIALVENHVPVLGVVFAPALDQLFAGDVSSGAWLEASGARRPIRCRQVPEEGLTVLGSRSHGNAAALDAYLTGMKVAARVDAGSSLKLCRIAAGEADMYPRLGRTMEWDIAAGQAVLVAAGGTVCDLHGATLRYGKPGFENPHFVARRAA